LRPGWLVTAAAHSPAAMMGAVKAGAGAVLLSPVFATESHLQGSGAAGQTLGPIRFARWRRLSPVPVYALGGMSAFRMRRLKGSGVRGYAGVGGVMGPSCRDGAGRV